ncbi:MAG: DUF1552 domain-containing protein [Acidobacteriota bacterium]
MKMIFKKFIPRRTFLRGVGTAIALPLLDGMVPAFGAKNDAAKAVARMAFFYGPNGRIMDQWTPATEGSGFKMSPTLEPLTPFQDQLLVLSGLDIKAADPWENERPAGHARPCTAYLTGVHPRPNRAVGISADQLAAREFGKHTQLGSLELTMEPSDNVGNTDGAFGGTYLKTISWRTPTTPLPMENNPRKVFERLLGEEGTTDPAERSRIVRRQQSILDSVTDGVTGLMAKLGPSDRSKLTEYLDAIRDIERRIQIAEGQTSRELPNMERPPGIPPTYQEQGQLMADLMRLAFQGDLTRVITFMWGQEQSSVNYREIGVPEGHHASSHHGGRNELIENCKRIDALHMETFAYFLDKLQSTPDGDGTLLDHSCILNGSGLSNGMAHLHHDIPMMVVGGLGKVKGGRHLRYEGVPLSNLLLTLLDRANVPTDGFINEKYSDATGRLDLLTM